jgi:hypothetical protein
VKQFITQQDAGESINSTCKRKKRPNIFYGAWVTEIKTLEPSIVLRIPNECLKLFRCDQYLRQPKMNPWADREYLSSIYAAFPWLTTRGTYRMRNMLTQKFKVVVYEKGTCLAREDCLMSSENLITVVSGLLNFYKRPDNKPKV